MGAWRKSSHCDTNTCVEIMVANDTVYIRDGKNPDGSRLRLDTMPLPRSSRTSSRVISRPTV